jgi:hypothetical protein
MLPRGPILVQSIYLSILYSDGNCVRTEPAGTVCARRARQSSGASARPRGDSTPTIIIDCPDPARCKAALEGADPRDPGGTPLAGSAPAERLTIQEEHLTSTLSGELTSPMW